MPQGVGSSDELTEFAIHFLLTGQGDGRRMANALVTRFPQRAALEIIYAMSVAAGSIESVLLGADSSERAVQLWRMAALVAVDLFMMQNLGLPTDTAADLGAYWLVYDRFFLT